MAVNLRLDIRNSEAEYRAEHKLPVQGCSETCNDEHWSRHDWDIKDDIRHPKKFPPGGLQ